MSRPETYFGKSADRSPNFSLKLRGVIENSPLVHYFHELIPAEEKELHTEILDGGKYANRYTLAARWELHDSKDAVGEFAAHTVSKGVKLVIDEDGDARVYATGSSENQSEDTPEHLKGWIDVTETEEYKRFTEESQKKCEAQKLHLPQDLHDTIDMHYQKEISILNVYKVAKQIAQPAPDYRFGFNLNGEVRQKYPIDKRLRIAY